MTINLHPVGEEFLSELRSLVPEPLAGFLAGLCAASACVWQEGGLMVRDIAKNGGISRKVGVASDDALVQEFFACVCGDRSGRYTSRALIARRCLLEAIHASIPSSAVQL